jgi:hypothetical protein
MVKNLGIEFGFFFLPKINPKRSLTPSYYQQAHVVSLHAPPFFIVTKNEMNPTIHTLDNETPQFVRIFLFILVVRCSLWVNFNKEFST